MMTDLETMVSSAEYHRCEELFWNQYRLTHDQFTVFWCRNFGYRSQTFFMIMDDELVTTDLIKTKPFKKTKYYKDLRLVMAYEYPFNIMTSNSHIIFKELVDLQYYADCQRQMRLTFLQYLADDCGIIDNISWPTRYTLVGAP